MKYQPIFADETIVFDDDDYNTWDMYCRAMNEETPVEELSKAPWFLELTEYEKAGYIDGVKKLQELIMDYFLSHKMGTEHPP